jgi:DNA-binding transcriptional MerR regulator/methylmalonyl-CoA mutase cobalamin-binding subunit
MNVRWFGKIAIANYFSRTGEMESSPPIALSIAAVERETGISKDVLRKWETRYGFPVPLRDSLGERAYPPEQVSRLRLIKRLMDAGMRPSRIVAESEASLNALAQTSRSARPRGHAGNQDDVEAVTLEMLRNQEPAGLRQRLYRELLRQGMDHFVLDTLEPLNHAVGEAWARGDLGVHEEHVYTEAVQWLLRNVIDNLSDVRGAPRILLTTLPEEQHGLGILMVAALLSLRGAYCISLGTQTPLQDIAESARAHRVDIVVLSFSIAYPKRRILPALAEMRERLGEDIEIWAGGAGCAGLNSASAGARLQPDMEQVLAALSEWRSARQ